MESQMTLELFDSYRTDRRELLNFVLSCNIEKVVLPPGVIALDDVDLDKLSVQYVLDRARKGLTLELLHAMKVSITNTQEVNLNTQDITCTTASKPSSVDAAEVFTDHDYEIAGKAQAGEYRSSDANANEFCLSLPPFETGLSEDDIREAAYEVLLASVGAAGGLMSLTKEKKEDKYSRVGKRKSQPSTSSGLAGLMDIMRIQMQITEESDKRTREALLHASAGRLGKRIDGLLLPLELLCSAPREGFSDQNIYLLWQKRQLDTVKEGILNNPHWNLDHSDHLATELRTSLSYIEESEAMSSPNGPAQRSEALKRVRDICLAISERTGKPEEICHWADGYYLNVRLYEKLLFSIYDAGKPNRFIEEVEEVLELLKSTWRVLGITQTVHDTCYTWVLFKRFVSTDEFNLLQHAARQMKKIATDRQRSAAERAYMKSLRSALENANGSQGLSYVQSVVKPIKLWADEKLNDYHLHFTNDRTKMETLLLLTMTAARLLADEEAGMHRMPAADIAVATKQAEEYVSSSIKRAYARMLGDVDTRSNVKQEHRLVLLAEGVKELAKKDTSLFSTLLSRWAPLSAVVTASVLHLSYYQELKPFLERISLLTDDDVTSVLPAADSLEHYLLDLIASVSNGDERINEYKQQMISYEVEVISGNLSMRCITEKLSELSKHVENAISIENWEPMSEQQRYGRSASDVFQFIEKVVDDFFNMELPMRISHLKGLTDGLNNAVRLYANKILLQLGDKGDLIPPAPALTRYKKEIPIRAFSKKKVSDPRLPDEKRSSELNSLTTAKLCVRLNTLHFVSKQLDHLEESIRQRWSIKGPQYAASARKRNPNQKQSEEIFPGLDASRKAVSWALEQTCEFTGIKIIFWDMRETYVDKLYKGGVSQCRVEKVVNGLDTVLGQLCEVLIEPLRDQVVFGLLEASLEGFLWVLLDGGPFRSFSQGDADILEQDLNVLKGFFIADGDGLPQALVDNAAAQVHNILNLYRFETHTVAANYRRASEQVPNATKGGPQVSDSEILLRVLCHRKDKEATKFLKQWKLPKPSS